MKIFSFLLLAAFIGITLTDCKKSKAINKYFIISQDSVCITAEKFKNNERVENLLPPPMPGFEWYSNLVIIFDSTDRVYIYQTQKSQNSNYKFELTKYPPFIGLQPYQLLSFKSEDFLSFIVSNNDLLGFDSTDYPTLDKKFVILASNKDTIRNKAFYQFKDLTKYKKNSGLRFTNVYYMIRMTTEEENTVIKYKRKNILELPSKINWSENFLHGNCKPNTQKYDSMELGLPFKFNSKESINKDCAYAPKFL